MIPCKYLYPGYAGYLDAGILRKPAHFNSLPRWWLIRKVRSIHLVNLREVIHVLQKNCRLHDVRKRKSRGFEYRTDVFHHLFCLILDVGRDHLACRALQGNLTRDKYKVAGPDCLAVRTDRLGRIGRINDVFLHTAGNITFDQISEQNQGTRAFDMKILVIGEDQVVSECKAKFGSQHEYFVTNSHLEARKMLWHASVVFDFILEEDVSQYQLLEDSSVPLFISTAKSTLAEIAGATARPGKPMLFGFNGLPTFVNRVILEVTMADKGHSEKLREICSQLGTAYEVVEDLPGMVTPRIVCMIINEAYCTIEDNTATADNIDIAMKLGTNYPHGPIEWSKRIGLKNVVDVLDAVYKHSGNERYRICELLREEARREM